MPWSSKLLKDAKTHTDEMIAKSEGASVYPQQLALKFAAKAAIDELKIAELLSRLDAAVTRLDAAEKKIADLESKMIKIKLF